LTGKRGKPRSSEAVSKGTNRNNSAL
jgi:hypothetical protein